MERIAPTPPPDIQARPHQPDANSSGAKAMPSAPVDVIAHAEQSKLLVELDADAGRFVQTLTDASNETIWQYPNEAQLAYSRAVMAYMRALANS